MENRAGRPRKYADHAARQAAYRRRIDEQAVSVDRQAHEQLAAALSDLRQAVTAAAKRGDPVAQAALWTGDADMIDALAAFFTGRAAGGRRYDLIPPEALDTLAAVFGNGERSHPRRTLAAGIRRDDHLAHARQHLDAYQQGEDPDKSGQAASGEDHLANAFARLAMAVAARARGRKGKG